MGAIRFCDNLSRQVQPPDAENRMSGGLGGVTGAIPLPPPDQLIRRTDVNIMPDLPGLSTLLHHSMNIRIQKLGLQIQQVRKQVQRDAISHRHS